VVLPALGPSLSHLKSRARVLSGCAILDYFPPFSINVKVVVLGASGEQAA